MGQLKAGGGLDPAVDYKSVDLVFHPLVLVVAERGATGSRIAGKL
jgi:hypothetical protein